MSQNRNRGRVAEQERRWCARYPHKNRAQARRGMARLRARRHGCYAPPLRLLPTEKEARKALGSLLDILGRQEVIQLLQTPSHRLTVLPTSVPGRALIGWLWCLVVKRPATADDLFTFGRFMERRGDDPGPEDWSI